MKLGKIFSAVVVLLSIIFLVSCSPKTENTNSNSTPVNNPRFDFQVSLLNNDGSRINELPFKLNMGSAAKFEFLIQSSVSPSEWKFYQKVRTTDVATNYVNVTSRLSTMTYVEIPMNQLGNYTAEKIATETYRVTFSYRYDRFLMSQFPDIGRDNLADIGLKVISYLNDNNIYRLSESKSTTFCQDVVIHVTYKNEKKQLISAQIPIQLRRNMPEANLDISKFELFRDNYLRVKNSASDIKTNFIFNCNSTNYPLDKLFVSLRNESGNPVDTLNFQFPNKTTSSTKTFDYAFKLNQKGIYNLNVLLLDTNFTSILGLPADLMATYFLSQNSQASSILSEFLGYNYKLFVNYENEPVIVPEISLSLRERKNIEFRDNILVSYYDSKSKGFKLEKRKEPPLISPEADSPMPLSFSEFKKSPFNNSPIIGAYIYLNNNSRNSLQTFNSFWLLDFNKDGKWDIKIPVNETKNTLSLEMEQPDAMWYLDFSELPDEPAMYTYYRDLFTPGRHSFIAALVPGGDMAMLGKATIDYEVYSMINPKRLSLIGDSNNNTDFSNIKNSTFKLEYDKDLINTLKLMSAEDKKYILDADIFAEIKAIFSRDQAPETVPVPVRYALPVFNFRLADTNTNYLMTKDVKWLDETGLASPVINYKWYKTKTTIAKDWKFDLLSNINDTSESTITYTLHDSMIKNNYYCGQQTFNFEQYSFNFVDCTKNKVMNEVMLTNTAPQAPVLTFNLRSGKDLTTGKAFYNVDTSKSITIKDDFDSINYSSYLKWAENTTLNNVPVSNMANSANPAYITTTLGSATPTTVLKAYNIADNGGWGTNGVKLRTGLSKEASYTAKINYKSEVKTLNASTPYYINTGFGYLYNYTYDNTSKNLKFVYSKLMNNQITINIPYVDNGDTVSPGDFTFMRDPQDVNKTNILFNYDYRTTGITDVRVLGYFDDSTYNKIYIRDTNNTTKHKPYLNPNGTSLIVYKSDSTTFNLYALLRESNILSTSPSAPFEIAHSDDSRFNAKTLAKITGIPNLDKIRYLSVKEDISGSAYANGNRMTILVGFDSGSSMTLQEFTLKYNGTVFVATPSIYYDPDLTDYYQGNYTTAPFGLSFNPLNRTIAISNSSELINIKYGSEFKINNPTFVLVNRTSDENSLYIFGIDTIYDYQHIIKVSWDLPTVFFN